MSEARATAGVSGFAGSPAAEADRVRRPVPEQADAIADRGRDLFLAAGAGTGKTTVLVERFCEAVCATEGEEADVGVENVLAFTFTERAAAELKRRIRLELGRRAAAAPSGASARRLRSLARDSESAWISTIHSFCRRVLASHPIAAGLDPAFRVLDEAGAGRLAAQAFDAAFRRFGTEADGDRFEMAAAYRLPELRTVVRSAHDELRSMGHGGPALPSLPAPDVAGAAAELHAAAKAALAATDTGGNGRIEDCRALVAAAAEGTAGRVPDSDEEVAGWYFKSSARALALPEVERYHEARAGLERRLVEDRFAGHYEHLRELLGLFAQEYAERKTERSALDFEDLQLGARRLLEAHPDVRARYRRQFRHVMIDEFQDTNALQLAIVKLLGGDVEEPGGRRFTVGDELQSIYGFRHADVEVFREERSAAEVAAYEQAGVRRLAGNFRSRPEVLALVNRVGRALFGAWYEDLALGRGADAGGAPDPAVEVLVTERSGWDESAGAALPVSPDERAQAWRIAEARFLARRLRALHDDGVPRGEMVVLLRSYSYVEAYEEALERAGLAPYVVGGRGYWSKQQVADVRNLLGCVANPLDDRALFGALASPACGVRPDTLWLLRRAAGRRPAWSALRWLFGPEQAASEERDGAPAAGSGGDGGSLAAWRRGVEELGRHVPDDDAGALREFVAVLEEVREEAPRLPLEALIDRVVTLSGYDLALLMRSRGRRRMANVRKLMRLAREFEAEEGRDLRAFLDFTASEADAGADEAEAAVDAEGHDGVRLMTVHAAKGLEFPVVAVADLGRRLSAGFPPALRLEPVREPGAEGEGEAGAVRVGLKLARLGRKRVGIFDHVELEERAVEREREEERRILHVAMTRAERQLILSGALELEKLGADPKPAEPLIAPVLRALCWSPEADAVEVEPPPLAPGVEARLDPVAVAVRTNVPGTASEADARIEPARPPAVVADGTDEDDRPLPDPDLAPPAPARAAPVQAVSYSALSLFERCGYRFYAERVLGLAPRLPARPGGAVRDESHPADGFDGLASRYARGRVVHRLLEQSARHGWSPPDPQHAAALLRSEGVDAGASQVARATRLVEAFLAAPLRQQLAGAKVILPEAPFSFRAGDLVVRGEIDLLCDLGSEVVVVDYKSDALGDLDPEAHMTRYEVQRLIYSLAALRRYGKPVRVVYLFLERPERPVEARFSPGDAGRIGDELTAITDAVADGRFEVTARPERSLCHDCPARERLCVYGPELTLRESAE